jgi:hypothetical protein
MPSDDVLALNPEYAATLQHGGAVVLARKQTTIQRRERGVYKNPLEALAAATWVSVNLTGWLYEAIRLYHDGGWYTPDFFGLAQGRPTFVEVKGDWHMKNARDARTKFRAAAAHHPWAQFVALTPVHYRAGHVDGWQEEYLR